MMTKSIAVVAALFLAPSSLACVSFECGDGTHEANGRCELDDGVSIETPESCGQDTYYDPTTMTCTPVLPPTRCDPSTTVPVVDPDTGIVDCVGVGGVGCEGTFLCQTPTAGKVSICGQLINVEDNTLLRAEGATGTLCDKDNPTADGPCSLDIQFYDAIDFSATPDTAVALAAGRLEIDDCGRFRGESISFPTQAPFIGIAIDDSPNSGADIWARAGVAIEVGQDQRDTGTRTYAVKHSTVAMWSESANSPYNFWDRGLYLPLFLRGNPEFDASDPSMTVHKRVSGATITSAGSVAASRDYYFSDSDANMLTTVDTDLTATGVNGAALMVDSELVVHGGTGGEPDGCIWGNDLAASIATVAYIQERIATNMNSGDVCE